MIGSAPIQIMLNGIGFRGEGCNGEARKGNLKVVIGINTCEEIFPLGTWAGTSWDAISRQWKEQKMKFPDSSILICDGEPGLSEAFAGTLALELPQEDFKYVSEEEKDYIEEQMEKTEAVIDQQIGYFQG